MASALTGMVGDLAGMLPSTNDLVSQLIAGAAGTVVLSGLKSSDGQNALDPLHWFHDKNSGTTGAVTGRAMTASAFNALSPATQDKVIAADYQIIPG